MHLSISIVVCFIFLFLSFSIFQFCGQIVVKFPKPHVDSDGVFPLNFFIACSQAFQRDKIVFTLVSVDKQNSSSKNYMNFQDIAGRRVQHGIAKVWIRSSGGEQQPPRSPADDRPDDNDRQDRQECLGNPVEVGRVLSRPCLDSFSFIAYLWATLSARYLLLLSLRSPTPPCRRRTRFLTPRT